MIHTVYHDVGFFICVPSYDFFLMKRTKKVCTNNRIAPTETIKDERDGGSYDATVYSRQINARIDLMDTIRK